MCTKIKSAAVANQSGAMEADTISKNGGKLKRHASRRSLRLILLISFLITEISLFGQVNEPKEKAREIISNVSSIDGCNAKELGLIFSIVLEPINNYFIVCYELDKAQNLAVLFSDFAKFKRPANRILTSSELSSYNLDITVEELFEEMLNQIDNHFFRADARRKFLSQNAAGKMRDFYLNEEINNLELLYDKTEKDIEEMIDIIEFIPLDYRYPLAVETMYGFVRNFRASTWKECADKYEEQLHRWTVEANAEQALRIRDEVNNIKSGAKVGSAFASIFGGLLSVMSVFDGMVNNAGQDMFKGPRYRETRTIIYD